MEIGEIISLYRKDAGMTLDELAEKSGVPKGTINKIIGGVTKAPTIDNIKAIARALGKRLADFEDDGQKPDFLSLTEQKILKKYRALDERGKQTVEFVLDMQYQFVMECQSQILKRTEEEKIITLPMPLQSVSAGTGQFADDKTTEDMSVLYNEYTAKADYILRVNGDSMEPKFYNGDLVLVREQPAVEKGEIGIFLIAGERYIKEYQGKYLHSLNPEWEDVRCTEYTYCRGKVIATLKEDWIR